MGLLPMSLLGCGCALCPGLWLWFCGFQQVLRFGGKLIWELFTAEVPKVISKKKRQKVAKLLENFSNMGQEIYEFVLELFKSTGDLGWVVKELFCIVGNALEARSWVSPPLSPINTLSIQATIGYGIAWHRAWHAVLVTLLAEKVKYIIMIWPSRTWHPLEAPLKS